MSANRSGEHPIGYRPGERERDDAAWDSLLQGPVKCRKLTDDEMCILRAKHSANEMLDMLGLSIRQAARLIGRDESTLREILDSRNLRREVPASFYDRLIVAVGQPALIAWREIHRGWIGNTARMVG